MGEINQHHNTNTGNGAGAIIFQWINVAGDFVNSGNIVNGGPIAPGELDMLRLENERLKNEVTRLLGIIENLTEK